MSPLRVHTVPALVSHWNKMNEEEEEGNKTYAKLFIYLILFVHSFSKRYSVCSFSFYFHSFFRLHWNEMITRKQQCLIMKLTHTEHRIFLYLFCYRRLEISSLTILGMVYSVQYLFYDRMEPLVYDFKVCWHFFRMSINSFVADFKHEAYAIGILIGDD